MTDRASTVVIGGGIVGCAVANELARLNQSPIVLEKGPRIAEGVTSRNSGVVHAGLYYPPESLKAQSCIRGARLLREWCEVRGVPYRQTGKWVVGRKADEESLQALHRNAELSGASGLKWVSPGELRDSLPGVEVDCGLLSTETGIVDAYEYTRSFRDAAEEAGASFIYGAEVTAIEKNRAGFRLSTSRGEIEADLVINAAGLDADRVARLAGIEEYTLHPCRGDYFRWATKARYDRLIYPVKKKGNAGLGIHLTIGLDGSYRLGPDAFYVSERDDFAPPPDVEKKRLQFFEAGRLYLRDLRLEDLSYESCGIRPKLRAPTEADEKDFVLRQDLPGFINLIGIESPGLTSAADLAQRAARLV